MIVELLLHEEADVRIEDEIDGEYLVLEGKDGYLRIKIEFQHWVKLVGHLEERGYCKVVDENG